MVKCQICQKELKNKRGLIRHIKRNHPDSLDYQCEICGQGCARLEDVTKHLKKKHRDISIEKYWEKYFKDKTNPEHTKLCRYCGKNNRFKGLGQGYGHGFCSFSCSTKWYALNTDRVDRAMNTIKDKKKKDKTFCLFPTQLEYWLNLGFSRKEAKKKQSERQTTFSKKICIEKYGREKGIEIWKKRQDLWLKTLDDKSPEEKARISRLKVSAGCNVSKAEKEISSFLRKRYPSIKTQYVVDPKIGYVYDICLGNAIIEYNGDYWHCNPEVYSEEYFNARIQMTAREKWEKDKQKIESAKREGYKVLVVWEKDYKKSTEETLSSCITFIEENQNVSS